jgi:hypothetical protein
LIDIGRGTSIEGLDVVVARDVFVLKSSMTAFGMSSNDLTGRRSTSISTEPWNLRGLSTLLAEFPADAHIGKQTREIFMPDNRNGGLPPFFPRAQDGLMAHAFNLDASSGHFSFFEGSAKIAAIVGGIETPLPLFEATTFPGLLLQTVIVPGARTNQGTLIEAVTLPWYDIIAFLKADPSNAFQIPWRKWEEIIAAAYKKAGFEEVTLTSRSGDHGCDVIAIKKGICSIRVIEQVKAYKPTHHVTANEVVSRFVLELSLARSPA